MISLATVSTLAKVRPPRKTSAPSIASSLATAAPIEPPAPNTTARLPCKASEADIRISLLDVESLGGPVRHQWWDEQTVEHVDTGWFSNWAIPDRPISAPIGVS